MKKILLLFIFFSMYLQNIAAQTSGVTTDYTQKIKGVILDADSKKPLASALCIDIDFDSAIKRKMANKLV